MSTDLDLDTLDLGELKNDADRVNAKTNAQENTFLDNFVKMPEGKGFVKIRLLPPRKGGKFYQGTRIHRINGKTFHCRKELVKGKWVGNDCPICNYIKYLYDKAKKLEDRGDLEEAKSVKAEAKSLLAYERYYYNAIVRNQPTKDGKLEDIGPKIFSCGKELHGVVLTNIVGDPTMDKESLGDVSNITTGRDFKVVKDMKASPEGNFASYTGSEFASSPSKLGEMDVVKNWINNMFDLSELRSPKSVDELERQIAIHRGLIKDENKSFDVDAFDARYGGAKVDATEVVVTTEDHVSSDPIVEETELSVDDDSFINDLKSIQLS